MKQASCFCVKENGRYQGRRLHKVEMLAETDITVKRELKVADQIDFLNW